MNHSVDSSTSMGLFEWIAAMIAASFRTHALARAIDRYVKTLPERGELNNDLLRVLPHENSFLLVDRRAKSSPSNFLDSIATHYYTMTSCPPQSYAVGFCMFAAPFVRSPADANREWACFFLQETACSIMSCNTSHQEMDDACCDGSIVIPLSSY